MKTFIITEPCLTTLYVGQLVSEKSLPALLEESFIDESDIDSIKYVPYTKALHEKYITLGKEIYSSISNLDYYEVY